MAGTPGAAFALLAGITQAAAHEIHGIHNVKRDHDEHDEHDDVTISHVDSNSLNLIIVLVLIAILVVLIVVVSIVCASWNRRSDSHVYTPMTPWGKDIYRPALCHPESCLESIGQSRSCHCDKGADKSRTCRWHSEVMRIDSSEVCSQCANRNYQGKKRKKIYRTEVSLTKLTPDKASKECAVQVDIETSTVPDLPNPKPGGGNETLFGAHRNEAGNPETVLFTTGIVPPGPSDRSLVRSQSAESSFHRARPNHVMRPANGLTKKSSKESASNSDPGLKRTPSNYQIVHVATLHQFKPITCRTRDATTKQVGSTEFQLTKDGPAYLDDTSVLLRTNAAAPRALRRQTTANDGRRHAKILDQNANEELSSSGSAESESNSESPPDFDVAASDSQSAKASKQWSRSK
ncbi:uncharacterized protein LOC135388006 [Ornithodoros turicata]|uniref:uncharacterized protein LOC135388006 n=1 Tax=Ornithodoros turicata TaxID=34597 RepID=UPI0031398C78